MDILEQYVELRMKLDFIQKNILTDKNLPQVERDEFTNLVISLIRQQTEIRSKVIKYRIFPQTNNK